MQLYQALKLRNEHRQFAMNIGATSILDQTYLDDDDDSQDAADDETSMEVKGKDIQDCNSSRHHSWKHL